MRLTIRKKYLFYVLAFSSSLIAAAVAGIDGIITSSYITNPWAFAISCFFVGIVITLALVLLFSIPIKKKSLGARFIDPSFHGLRMVRKEEIKPHILAGVGNSLMTIAYLLLLSFLGDPSSVLPFAQITILYLVVIESVTEKNIPTLVEIESSLVVTFGAILASLSLSSGISLEALLVVFLLYNPAWVLFSVYQRKLKLIKINQQSSDALNIRFWNLVFSSFITLGIVALVDVLMGTSNVVEGFSAIFTHTGWLVITMGLAFFNFVFYIRALGIGKASVTQAVRASIVVFTIPFSILIAYLGYIPMMAVDSLSILIKFIGIVLVMLGIISFALHMVKGYLFIRVKRGYSIEDTLQQIWNIRGVNRVSATAGPYDFIAEIRIRTLVKGYERIIKRLESIEAIDKYTWQSVLKEWEDV